MARRRFIYRKNEETGMVDEIEVSFDWVPESSRRTDVVTDLYMDGIRASDGADIGSRAKRREYMKVHGLADASDYTNTWAKAKSDRAEFYLGKAGHSERKSDVAASMRKLRK